MARAWHGVTFAVVMVALVLQTVLVIDGAAVLDESTMPPLPTRLFRLAGYFTIQSNVLVAIATGLLLRDPDREGRGFRVLRLDAVVAITVTGLVHWFLLRPLLDLEGASAVADTLLHVVVPLLAVVGFVVVGPRPRIDVPTAALALAWPLVWTVVTLIVGAIDGWYPYPFLDVGVRGLGPVLLTCLGVTVLFVGLIGLCAAADRGLPRAPAVEPEGRSAD